MLRQLLVRQILVVEVEDLDLLMVLLVVQAL